ncbi:hypothetical protein [Paenibacillus aquistagni]|uniref:Prenylated flavin chaperone LpdD-like domain-containing protein n=1 Tax=Paenibacillus aquistagni TaxID=1852522 RepID=A0A1X7J8L9_9BACL|nr:hypothetical protein [Paenibacillus aquistagni]SMG24086.1 hypothetical protein SAMN06295960_1348 [Paenibacillus aquistagni]
MSSWKVPEQAIQCRVTAIGRDWLIVLTGGDKESDHHIGAISTIYRDLETEEPQVMTQSIPGHKEHLLTEDMAQEAAQVLNGNITIIAGVHFDHLKKEQIAEVVDASWQVFRSTLYKHLNHN